jgi:hypothetical protein
LKLIEASALGKRHESTLALRTYISCHRGVPVELHIHNGQNPEQAGNPFFAQAQAFLARRFEKLPFQNRCSAVGPGNSVGHVQAAAS